MSAVERTKDEEVLYWFSRYLEGIKKKDHEAVRWASIKLQELGQQIPQQA